MRVLRRTWPLAGVLFVTLASAGTAWGDGGQAAPDRSATAATAGQIDTSFRLFGKTWCLAGQPHATPCDFTLPASPAPAPAATATGERPVDRFMTALRRLFGGSPEASTTAAAGDARSGRAGG